MNEPKAFGARLGWGQRPLLLVVDICRAYLDPNSELYAGVEDAVASAARVLAAARRQRVPVIFTTVRFAPEQQEGCVFYRKIPALAAFNEGNPLGDIAPPVTPADNETVLVKQHASAFTNDSLLDMLRQRNVDTLVIIGLSTSGCIRATAVDAIRHNYIPIVVRDAVGDRDPNTHEQSLTDLGNKYADIVSEAEVLAAFAVQVPS